MNRVYPPVRGATGRLLKDAAEAFARNGWHVTVVSSGKRAGEERKNGVRIIRVKGGEQPKTALSYMWVWLKMLVLALRLKSRDVLVTMSDPPLIIVAGSIVAKVKKSSHVNWCQDLYPDIVPVLGIKMPEFLFKWFKAKRIRAMKSCDRIIVCGRCMMKRLVLDGINAQKIKVIANWPDLELVDPDMADIDDPPYEIADTKVIRPFEKQIKEKQRFRVLYAGNIGLAHPIDVIIEAARIFQERDSDIEFVFVGDGKRFDYIMQERAKMCLDNIRILPFQPYSRLREVMESGDVHLITMKEEAAGFIVPCKFYAALAVARPSIFIGSRACEVAKIISDYEAGFVVAQGDAENLVNAIYHFRENRDAWYKAHSGAVRARVAFTPKASMDMFMEYIQEIAKVR